MACCDRAMTGTVIVENTGASDLTLPCGTRIPARGAVSVPVKSITDHRENPVIRAWFGDGRTGVLRAAEPLPGLAPDGSGCDCAATQLRIAEWVETARRHAAERDAAADVLGAAQADLAEASAETGRLAASLVAANAEVERLTADLAAANAAKADAEALAALVQEEAAKPPTDAPKGKTSKAS